VYHNTLWYFGVCVLKNVLRNLSAWQTFPQRNATSLLDQNNQDRQ